MPHRLGSYMSSVAGLGSDYARCTIGIKIVFGLRSALGSGKVEPLSVHVTSSLYLNLRASPYFHITTK